MGLCGPQGCIMGILSLRGHEERGKHINDLEFSIRELYLASLMALLSLSIHPWGTSRGEPGSFSDEWKQNKAAMATLDTIPSAWICPLSPPGLPFLPPPFLLNAEQRRWVHQWFQVV